MKKYFLLLTVIMLLQGVAFSQVKAANKKFDKMAYSAAIVRYERALRKDSTNKEVWEKLGYCYKMTQNPRNAERAFKHATDGGTATPENYLYYAEALMQNEKYPEAKAQLDNFIAARPSDERGKNLEQGIADMAKIKSREGVYVVKKTNVNSGESDFSPTVHNGGIVFASNRTLTGMVGYSHSWTGKQFYRLYEAKGSETDFSAPVLFADNIQTKYHDGPVCFNATGSQMYFTRNNIENGKVRKDDNEKVGLKIFMSNWSEGKWGIDVPFLYNSDSYNCAHPTLSADGKTLYFASDMPGGHGGMDIWKCEWQNNAWAQPQNLGATINTKGNEVFPHVSADNTLFFSSDGLPSLGGLDIFSSQPGAMWSQPDNMGSPVNSSDDDFGISYNSANNTGYFTSNRKAEGQNDDIYYFTKQCTNVTVLVTDEITGEVLADAEVLVLENMVEKEKVITDASGKFNACLNPASNYEFRAKKDNYTNNKSTLSSSDLSASVGTGKEVKVSLKKNEVTVVGRVYNQDDKSPVPGQTVTLKNLTSGEVFTATTDPGGNYTFETIALNNKYEVKTNKKDCGEAREDFNTNNISGAKMMTFDLPLLCKGDIIKIENIYYDYNKSDIRPDAGVELDKVVVLLNKYPNMVIELRSHTDSRGKDAYNLKLSDSRAKAAVEYIISKGIPANRLVAKGYGETELLNRCKNNVECDDKEHEQNRRTEFKILQM